MVKNFLDICTGSIANCHLVWNEFAIFLNLNSYAEVCVEQFFCISNLHAGLDLKAFSLCVNSFSCFIIELLKSKCSISNLLSFVKYEFYSKCILKFCRESLKLLLRRAIEFCLSEIVFDFV